LARKISVEIVGDASSVQRSFAKAGASAKTFDRDLGKSVRGVAAASLSFHGLGRALSFASGYFLASGGLVFGLKAATKAAIDHQATEAQLAAAVTHSGMSFVRYGQQISETLTAQEKLSGFSEEDSVQSFTKLLRTTRDLTKATQDNQLAMEIARGAGISLNAASNIVNKTLAGQTTGLRRLGVELPKGVSGYRALQIAGEKYGGSLAAWSGTAAGKQALLGLALHETEVSIGTALLPTITRLSGELADWLNKSDNQKRVQGDVAEAVRDTTAVVKVFAGAVKVAADAVGGFKHLMELLIGLKVARTLAAWRTATILFGASAGTAGAAGSVGTLLLAVKKLAAISAVSIAIRFPGLAAGLSGLLAVPGAIAAATAAAVLSASGDAPNVPGLPKGGKGAVVASLGSHGQIPESVMKAAAKSAGISSSTVAGKAFQNDKFVNFLYAWVKKHGLLGTAAGGAGVEAAAKSAAGKSRAVVAGMGGSAGVSGVSGVSGLDALSKIQNQVAQARLAASKGTSGAQAQLVAALKAEIDYDAKYAAIQTKLADRGGKDAAKHAQKMQQLLADEASAYDEIAAGQSKVESSAKKASTAAKAAAKKRAEEARKAAAARKKALADAAAKAQTFTVPMNLLIAQAKAGSTSTAKDDIAVALRIKAFAEATIRSNKKKGQALVDAWDEITNEMSVIGTKAKPVTGFRKASLASLTAGLGLSPAARKMAEARLAQAQAHSGYVPTGQGVLGQQITIHINGAGNPDAVAEKVIAKINRGRTQSVTQRRGPNAGYQGRH
jgi:hypothetical protein